MYYAIAVLCVALPISLFFLSLMFAGMFDAFRKDEDRKMNDEELTSNVFGGGFLGLIGLLICAWMFKIIFG